MRLALALGAMLGMTACSDTSNDLDDLGIDDPDAGRPTVQVPIRIEMETAWNVDEQTPHRAPPPGAGSGNNGSGTSTVSDGWTDGYSDVTGVNEVRIVTFRRRDTSDAGSTTEPFLYDARNSMTVPILGEHNGKTDGYITPHSHPYTEATLTKVYGYEYRIVAIAYNTTRTVPFAASANYNGALAAGEHNWFTLNLADGLRMDDFMATLRTQTVEDNASGWREFITGNSGTTGATEHVSQLSHKLALTPQLFWGYLHLEGNDDPIIRFQTTNASGNLVADAPLTGLLYRGMAKIELHITLEKRSRGGTSNNVDWLALMGDHIMTQTHLADYDDFLTPLTPVPDDGKYTAIDFIASTTDGAKVMEAWVLPTRTRLAIRGKYVWALAHHVNNGQLCADNISYADMGTGIIAADVADNIFTLRRNHKYVLVCNSSEAVFNNHEID